MHTISKSADGSAPHANIPSLTKDTSGFGFSRLYFLLQFLAAMSGSRSDSVSIAVRPCICLFVHLCEAIANVFRKGFTSSYSIGLYSFLIKPYGQWVAHFEKNVGWNKIMVDYVI